MNIALRRASDRGFTGMAIISVALLTAALLVILIPMMIKGGTAVFFEGTIEFRHMQLELYERGKPAEVLRDLQAARKARQSVYALIEEFREGIDFAHLEDEAKGVYRELGKQLDEREVAREEKSDIRRFVRGVRNTLIDAYEATDKAEAERALRDVLKYERDEQVQGTVAVRLFEMAREYQKTLEGFDLSKREEYAAAFDEVQVAIRRLFGPPPGADRPPLAKDRYGAHRMDLVERWSDDVLYAEKWVEVEPSQPLVKKKIPREEQFAGTSLEQLFPLYRRNVDAMFLPRGTAYWQYLLDSSVPGHYFGGVGPEILGTLVVTLVAIGLAFPVGVISAAYLVEVAGDNIVIRFIRMCINTLAGVPSIVFGLFAIAFFVMFVTGRPCVLACSATAAVLVLPVIIRASEEAIRAVPRSYKEAALALGASHLRCFLTVQLPAALPGILTGIILSLARAAGETAPYLFAGAAAVARPLWEAGISEWPWCQTQLLSYGAYDLAMNDRIAAMVPHQQWGMVMTLIGLVLILNIVAIVIRWRVSRELRGG